MKTLKKIVYLSVPIFQLGLQRIIKDSDQKDKNTLQSISHKVVKNFDPASAGSNSQISNP